MTKDEALKLALDYIQSTADYKMGHPAACETAFDLREALAQPQQEPVAWWHQKSDTFTSGSLVSNFVEWVPLYTKDQL